MEENLSSNRDWLGYNESDLDLIVVTDEQGNTVFDVPSNGGRLRPAYWLSNETLVLDDLLAMDPDYDFAYGGTDALVLLNPFTGEEERWFPEFPDQWTDLYYLDWQTSSGMAFHPSLEYVAYVMKDETDPVLRLWPLEGPEELARVYAGRAPKWSPDGTQVLVEAPDGLGDDNRNFNDALAYRGGTELLLVGLSGQTARLTYFTSEAHTIEVGYTWSPSGLWITAWKLEPLTFRSPELIVISSSDKAAVSYCEIGHLPESSNSARRFGLIPPPDPVWSPDEQFIAFAEINDPIGETRAIIVRVENGQTWEIAEHMVPTGWLDHDS